MTANEDFFDALIRHQTYLLRYSSQVRNQITKILNDSEREMARRIATDLRGLPQGFGPKQMKKFKAIQKHIKRIRGKAWKDVSTVWIDEFTELVKNEPAIAAQMLATAVPVAVAPVLPQNKVLLGIIKEHPFEGKVLRDWAKSIEASDITRIENTIKVGMVQGDTSKQIARRVVGTASLKGRDGVTQITRTNAAAITRTAMNSLSNAARSQFFNANQDLFKKELFVATLDSRTTPVCMSNDGKQFEPGRGPVPPLHFNCRSLRVPTIDGDILGDRPFKASTEKQLLREFSKQNNLTGITSRAGLPRGTKGSFDTFKRKRVRELTGQVPAKISYQEWLKRQSSTFQNDTLGKTKGKLFRDGGLQLDKFVDAKGSELTLSQLAGKHTEAFKAAGLDPSDF